MFLIISPYQNSRLAYVAILISKFLNCEVKIQKHLPSNQVPFLCYADTNYCNAKIFIASNGLLLEKHIRPIEMLWDTDLQCLLAFKNKSTFGFDVFSAMFFHVTRYEEYLIQARDDLGRFKVLNAVLFKNNLVKTPLVDLHLLMLQEAIFQCFPQFSTGVKQYQYLPSMDIDIAFDYLGRDLKRNIGAALNDIYKLKLANLWKRILVNFGLAKDPAFIFNKVLSTPILYFIHTGKYGAFDKSCGFNHPEYLNFIKNIPRNSIAIHPSFQSYLAISIIKSEIEKLEKLSGKQITKSRQHFIKLILPESYQMLIQLGITDDYSMGWPNMSGYRAGTAMSYPFFDLTTNELTNLTIHPFMWMDTHYIFNNDLTLEDGLREFEEFKQHCKRIGVPFIPIFHNNHFKIARYTVFLDLLNSTL